MTVGRGQGLAEGDGLSDAFHEVARAGDADIVTGDFRAVALAATQFARGIAIGATLNPFRRPVSAGERERSGDEDAGKRQTRYASIAYQGHDPLRCCGRRGSPRRDALATR